MNIDFDRLKYSLTGEYEKVMLEKQLKEKDKEIERLNNIINDMDKQIDNLCNNQKREVERLNNIINELKERSLLYSKEIDRLLTIKEEVREYIENAFATGEEIFKVEILEILDKENK